MVSWSPWVEIIQGNVYWKFANLFVRLLPRAFPSQILGYSRSWSWYSILMHLDTHYFEESWLQSRTKRLGNGRLLFVMSWRLFCKLVFKLYGDTSLAFTGWIFHRTESISGISRWYIQSWSSKSHGGTLHATIALQLCKSLRTELETETFPTAAHLNIIEPLCEKAYTCLAELLDFGSPLQLTEGNQCKLDDGFTLHIPTAVTTLNDFVLSYNVSIEHCLYANHSDYNLISPSTHPTRDFCLFLDQCRKRLDLF